MTYAALSQDRGPVQEREVTGLGNSFRHLTQELDALDKMIDMARERLAPLLRQEHEMTDPDTSPPKAVEMDSPIVADLNNHLRRLRSATNRLSTLISQVDL